jgi:sugar lactone lactonase YvrE
MKFRSLATLGALLAIYCGSMPEIWGAEPPSAAVAMSLAREATAAAEARNFGAYLELMERAVALRPDFPRILVNTAAAQVANDRPEEAIATLERLAALGLNSPVEKSADFASLRGRAEFEKVVRKLTANLQPRGAGQIIFSLPEMTGLIEGIAWRAKTGAFFFGDVNGRAVWRWTAEGVLTRFTAPGGALPGVFGLLVDEERQTLWAACSAVPAMRGFTPDQDGTAALAEIDLESGAVRQVVPLVRQPGDRDSHVLGDLTMSANGEIFLSDSGAPKIWRYVPGGPGLELFAESEELMSPQGIVALPDGEHLVVADHANGLLAVSLRTRRVSRLEAPAGTTLIGLDGLALSPNGTVLAIQNGLRPNRILRIALDGGVEAVAEVAVLESGHLTMAAPSLGCLGPGGDFYFVGNAGWTRFENTDGAPSTPRSVPIFRTRL